MEPFFFFFKGKWVLQGQPFAQHQQEEEVVEKQNNYQTPFAPEKIAVSRVAHVDVFTSCQFSLVQLG